MKKGRKVLLALLAIFLGLCVVAIIAFYAFREYSDNVMIPGLEQGASGGTLVKTAEGYYELQPSDRFAELFAFDEWEQTREKPSGDPAIALCFAEEWIVEIYSGGAVSAYYGYASNKQKSNAYYMAPPEIVEALSSFVKENGTPQEGQFLESSFSH